MLGHIKALYAIDAEIRGRASDDRRIIRQERSRAVVEEVGRFLEAKLAQISRKSTLAEAIRYATARWAGLIRFFDDGRIELGSNAVERAIRRLAPNRKTPFSQAPTTAATTELSSPA